MLTLDTNKLASFLGLRREVTGGVKIYDATNAVTRTLLPSETLAGFTIENSVPKGKFFGFAVSQKLTVNLVNETTSIEKGTKLIPYLGVKDGEPQTLTAFFVDSVEIDTVKKTTKITAYDAIYFASNKRLEEVSIEYPLSLKSFATVIVNALNCYPDTDAIESNLNIQLTQETVNVNGSENLQEILTAICEITGTICRCGHGNRLEFINLSGQVAKDTILPMSYFNFTSQEPITLTKVASVTQLGENYISGAEEGFTQSMWDNPFLELREDTPTIVDTIQAKVNGLVMLPYTLESRGNPYYQIGDCLSIMTALGEKTIFWFNETLEYKGGLRSKTSWEEGEDEKPSANPTTLGEAVKMTSAKVDKVNNEVNIIAGTSSENSQAIAALRMNTESISASVTNLREATEGAMETVNGDINTLTKKVEATMTSEAVDLKIQSAMSQGVNNVTTSTGFTFNEAGLTVSKSGSEMTTRIDEDGMAVFRDNTEVLTADNQGVIAYNLHAKTYLIIGENSRFEDYTNTSGEARTGCFWIGG